MDSEPDDKTMLLPGQLGPREKPDEIIGRYRLIEMIGEGGMGTVWLAEQQEPLVRRVALKIIKLGMDTGEVVARFEQERQALALMDHPAIAKVLDAGATGTGRPYFVMELVDGLPLTEYCDRRQLGMSARLRLFIEICQALQHAHQKGIIHRDLKPSNILVSTGDQGQPLPKVIDFGIAKATGPALKDHTALTHFAQVIGTPAYMSPEQAGLGPADIDTRSDIYSLGVVLYELLTGRPPFDPRQLVKAGMEEMRRIIREETPPRPSTRLAALGEQERTSLAARRGATVARITTALRGDLDWIVMKALEKDRRRRYETVGALAADLQRHLEHQPVEARPPGAAYLLSRFVRRHKIGFAAGAAVALALIAGLTAATWGFFKAEAERKVADAERDKARLARGTAEGLINSMLYDLRDKLQPIGRLELLDDVSRRAEQYFEEMLPGEATPQVLREKSGMLINRGNVLSAGGKMPAAQEAFGKSLAIMEQLTALSPGNRNWQQHLSVCHSRIADAAKALGNLPGARAAAAKALAISEQLAIADPDNSVYSNDVALSFNQVGELEDAAGDLTAAQAALSRALSIRESLAQRDPENAEWQRNLAASYQRLGQLAKDSANLKAAADFYDKALVILEKLAQADPANTAAQIDLAIGYQYAGDAAADGGELERAGKAFAKDLAISKRLADSDPDNALWQRGLAISYEHMASLAKTGGDMDAARIANEKSLAIRERLATSDPANVGWQSDLANGYVFAAQLAKRNNNPDEAARLIKQAREIMERVIRQDSTNMNWQLRLSVCWLVAGDIARGQGDLESARTAFANALTEREKMALRDPVNADWQSFLAEAHDRVGDTELASDNHPAARVAYTKALSIREGLAGRDQKNAKAQRELMISYAALGKLAKKEGDLPAQREAFAKSLAICERLAQSDPGNADRQDDWAVSCIRMSEVEKAAGDEAQSTKHRQKAVEILRKMKADGMKLDTVTEIFLMGETLRGR